MRIVIAMNLPYSEPTGGANKANRALAEVLARSGHRVHIVARSASRPDRNGATQERRSAFEDAERSISVHEGPNSLSSLLDQMECVCSRVRPEWILVSSEDPMQLLLARALEQAGSKVMILVHSPGCVPVGPDSFHPSERGAALYQRADSVISFSRTTADYLKQWAGVFSEICRLPLLDRETPPRYSNYALRTVSMFNVCAYKGRDIFISVAKRMSDVRFLAVAGWGTTRQDRTLLAELSNIQVVDASPEIEPFFASSSIVIVPSLCQEGFSLITVESLIRYIPVLIADRSGLREAAAGGARVIPVRPITQYHEFWDDAGLWIAETPAQEVEAWIVAISDLLESEVAYKAVAARGAQAALASTGDADFGVVTAKLAT